ncbi:MAG: DNA translocase FtsK 4TM domain-containing protein [Proteobacteria bacterium]|nr:DNA translocase FtsK 4TM domain-containing protein [Pseudomonadota bacterium]
MTAAVRSQNTPFLPPAWAAMLKRAALFAAGLSVVMLCVLMLLALISYSPDDPSLNTATNLTPQNALGLTGAIMSDALLQTVGLGALAIIFAVAAWGVRLMRGETVGWLWLRTVAMITASLLLAIGFEIVPAFGGWPIAAGLGGAAGDVLLKALTAYGAPAVAITLGLVVGLAAAAAGAGLLLWSMTVRFAVAGAACIAAAKGLTTAAVVLARAPMWVIDRLPKAEPAEKIEKPVKAKRERVEPVAVQTADEGEDEEIEAPAQARAILDEDEDEAEETPRTREASVVETRPKPAKPSKREMAARQGDLLPKSKKDFDLPSLDILTPPSTRVQNVVSKEALEANARMLESVLDDFGIKGQIVKVRPGPVVTLYELEPAPGTKTSRVVSLADDIARSMSAVAVRIAVVPGRSVIGIELPNANRETVLLREQLATEEFERSETKLVLALGKDIGGAPVFADLARMPHLLVAGTTGSGKSVAINTMIMSLLYRNTPKDVRLIMIDPKMLELSVYDGIPHLLAPVVTEPGKAVMALKWVVREMENRYRAMSQLSVRNVSGYNQRLAEAVKAGKTLTRTVQTGFDPGTGKPIYEEQALDMSPLPYIVVIIDEMADLMLVAGKDVEAAVQRLAQMARAAGIHVIMATQRPSVDVITGTIKANFPTRISFQVTSKIDSRTILGEQGAEQLLGQGDMLYMAAGGRITRVHGPFVSDKEVEEVTAHLRAQAVPDYVEAVTEEDDLEDVPGFSGMAGGNTSTGDGLFDQAVAIVARERKASTSFIQRHLQIGYNRAAKIIEDMEKQGMISKANHVGKREILLPEPQDM